MRQFPLEWYAGLPSETQIDVSPVQREKATSPISVTELPILTEVSPVQP